MLLAFPNGEPFATGATVYDYRPFNGGDTSERLILRVVIQGQLTSALVDTGAPYVICSPELAGLLNFDPASALYSQRMLIRGVRVKGSIHRVSVTLLAMEGHSLSLEATAFVPDPEEQEYGTDFPSFLGLLGCLEWIRFAVDPAHNVFYFGPRPS